MIIIACPGQGSQTPGFLNPWLAEQRFQDMLEWMSNEVAVDLVAHGTVSDSDTIRDTAVAQPLIVAAGLMAVSALLAGGRRKRIGGIAGHSVGEVTAASGAGVLSPRDALRFVRERGKSMADAAAITATGMSAVLGADQDELLARLDELGLEPANFNGGGQVVVAGDLAALTALKEAPPAKSRVIPLEVAGAFHTRYMQPAVERLAAVAADLNPIDPTMQLWTNRDGSAQTNGRDFIDLMVGQVSTPVRWDMCMNSFSEAGITGLIEVTPSGSLTGLARRSLKGVPTLAIKTPDDLPEALQMIDDHA